VILDMSCSVDHHISGVSIMAGFVLPLSHQTLVSMIALQPLEMRRRDWYRRWFYASSYYH